MLAPPLQRLVTELSKLPGIGNRTAQRLAFHILRVEAEEANALADAIRSLTGARLRLTYDLREQDEQEPEAEPTMSEDDMIDRFKAEFEAEEIVPHDDDEEPPA